MTKKSNLTANNQYLKVMHRIAKNIQKVRNEKDLSQEDMATYGFERRWYQRIESGTYSISLPTLVKLATAFKVDVSVFFL